MKRFVTDDFIGQTTKKQFVTNGMIGQSIQTLAGISSSKDFPPELGRGDGDVLKHWVRVPN